MLDGFVGAGSTPRVIMSSNSSGASGAIAVVHVDDVRQHLVVHLDQRQRLFGDRGAGGRHRGDRVALVQRLLARQDVARDVPEVHRDALGADVVELLIREVLRGDHRLHAGQLLGRRGVDRADARMRVRRAQDPAEQHARQRSRAPYIARPVTLGTPSGRIGLVPTHLNASPQSVTTVSFTATSPDCLDCLRSANRRAATAPWQVPVAKRRLVMHDRLMTC